MLHELLRVRRTRQCSTIQCRQLRRVLLYLWRTFCSGIQISAAIFRKPLGTHLCRVSPFVFFPMSVASERRREFQTWKLRDRGHSSSNKLEAPLRKCTENQTKRFEGQNVVGALDWCSLSINNQGRLAEGDSIPRGAFHPVLVISPTGISMLSGFTTAYSSVTGELRYQKFNT